FAPLTVNSLVETWEADPMGMLGGFLSQSVVTPEIDGAIRPFALFAQYRDGEGLLRSFAIPERLETFVRTVKAYLALADKPNAEKRVAIFYFKGPGQSAMTAGGMEVVPSLYNLLKRMQAEGYRLDGLPDDHRALERVIMRQGAIFGSYAAGARDDFAREGNPEWITREAYEAWALGEIRPAKLAEAGEFPGPYLSDDAGRLGIARLQFGNVALLPQPAAGSGSNSFQVVHGTNAAPPPSYIAPYLWARHGFKADALVHFGTHGSLEFTPKTQVALSSDDWPDRLVGPLPHFYLYTISNVGEGVIAKRRAYAGLQSYLTPPFMESDVRGIYRELTEKIKTYNNRPANDRERAAAGVKEVVMKLGIHRELGLDSAASYSEEDVLRVENFAEELATEKITGQLYTLGAPYEAARVTSTVVAMTVDPVAYGMLALDRARGKAGAREAENRALFTRAYLEPARRLVDELLARPAPVTDERVCRVTGASAAELARAREIVAAREAPSGMMAMMAGGNPRGAARPEFSKEEVNLALALLEVERALKNVAAHRASLLESPEEELRSLLNALAGGYTSPSPGGDPVANPNTLPTGRNLYAINAEATPSESAWDKGVQLAKNTIDLYRRRHDGAYPREVSYTLWSSEFIETGGATIAQVLYMLGVEPVRDAFGRVSDLRLIPSAELGRPRVDVVVQTSGQLRDIAASRLFLVNRAVEMAAAAGDDLHENFVASGVVASERLLMERGLSPREARELSAFRVFGGANGGYGTGIQGMVESGDRWENESEIAATYLNNMGAYYGSEKAWELFRRFAFEAALSRVDVVIQPRQSNTWGALSLDHVYEFMGGLTLAARHVTGKDPDAYFSDYRNRNNARVQELKEAIGVESRVTLFNPAYIREKMKGEASSAGEFAEIVRNAHGWNVMKPSVIDDELWDEIHDVYARDKFGLGVREFFERENPAALEEMTAVMLETARKGYWNASEERLSELARLHAGLVTRFLPSCSGFVCDNAKLRDFIATRAGAAAPAYRAAISRAREVAVSRDERGVVLKKEDATPADDPAREEDGAGDVLVAFSAVAAFILLVFILRRARRRH
ncbi:MAG: cobaltochelatase subunit CobN, partial [Odoribacteraceae bacterium]|nr:cobaltochelatase subunit CobN [Odoribacteraceae bacterium]